jgi:predicted ATP-dependent protease
VLIPDANAQHLMLRQEVVDAAAAGRFSVIPIESIDQGLELLTGVPAGVPDATGAYPEGTLNHRIAVRLAAFARRAVVAPPGVERRQRRRRNDDE